MPDGHQNDPLFAEANAGAQRLAWSATRRSILAATIAAAPVVAMAIAY